MITKTQGILIREICEIQCNSLDTIIINTEIGKGREEILKSFGLTRKDFDKVIIKSRLEFQKVYEDPNKFYDLNYEGFIVALFILGYLKEKYLEKYPKAISNLSNKIKQLMDVNEYQN